MDSYEVNKYFGATTGALMVFFAVAFGADALFVGHGGGHGGEEKLAFSVRNETAKPEGPGPDSGAPAVSIATLMATADPAAGERVFNKCKSCHNAGKGEANKIGPLLYGVVGRAVGSAPEFDYSPAMAAHGGVWGWEELNAFLTSPKGYVPGTKMTLSGLGDKDRADVLAFLNQHSDAPLPSPAKKAEAAAPAPVVAVAEAVTAAAGSVAESVTAAAAAVVAAAPGGGMSLGAMLAEADAGAGERVFRKCKACHNGGKGEANKIGPALYGVVGRPVAMAPGFTYSPAMAAKGGAWSFEELNAFLAAPKDYVPGTKMAFAGLNDKDRANVMLFLNQNSDSPLSLP